MYLNPFIVTRVPTARLLAEPGAALRGQSVLLADAQLAQRVRAARRVPLPPVPDAALGAAARTRGRPRPPAARARASAQSGALPSCPVAQLPSCPVALLSTG